MPKSCRKVRSCFPRLVAYTHELDPTRPAAIGGCQRGGIDKLGDIAGYNGDGARLFTNPGVPSVVSEYGSTMADRPANMRRAGAICPAQPGQNRGGILAVTLAQRRGHLVRLRSRQHCRCRFGGMGIMDYFRLPKRQWYWYRNEYRHIPPPAWPTMACPPPSP